MRNITAQTHWNIGRKRSICATVCHSANPQVLDRNHGSHRRIHHMQSCRLTHLSLLAGVVHTLLTSFIVSMATTHLVQGPGHSLYSSMVTHSTKMPWYAGWIRHLPYHFRTKVKILWSVFGRQTTLKLLPFRTMVIIIMTTKMERILDWQYDHDL